MENIKFDDVNTLKTKGRDELVKIILAWQGCSVESKQKYDYVIDENDNLRELNNALVELLERHGIDIREDLPKALEKYKRARDEGYKNAIRIANGHYNYVREQTTIANKMEMARSGGKGRCAVKKADEAKIIIEDEYRKNNPASWEHGDRAEFIRRMEKDERVGAYLKHDSIRKYVDKLQQESKAPARPDV